MHLSSPSKTGTILLIDDEAVVRTAVADYLQFTGYSVIMAEDGQAGLEIFKQRQGEIDLIMLDVSMPVMNGLEALTYIRQLSTTVPIIIFSGLDEPENLTKMGALQFTTFMKKPFRLNELIKQINGIVNQ